MTPCDLEDEVKSQKCSQLKGMFMLTKCLNLKAISTKKLQETLRKQSEF